LDQPAGSCSFSTSRYWGHKWLCPEGEGGQDAAQELDESAQQRAQSVKETATGAASAVTDEAQSKTAEVTGHVHEARDRVIEQASQGGS
jgi:hypothetical protein